MEQNSIISSRQLAKAIRASDVELVKKLIHKGAELNPIYEDFTPLGLAVLNNQLGIVKVLIEAGADLDFQMEEVDKYTALMIAAGNGNLDIVKTLVEAGADVNLKSIYEEHALSIAAFIGNKEIFDYLYSLTIPEYKVGKKVLKQAIRSQNIVRDINGLWKDKEGKTALMYAIEDNDNVEKIRLLIQNDSNINKRDNKGNTALSLAKEIGNTEIIQELLDAGAMEDEYL